MISSNISIAIFSRMIICSVYRIVYYDGRGHGPFGANSPQGAGLYIGVRGCPERVMSSLCVIGWGWEMLGNSSAAVAAVVAVAAVPPKGDVFLVTISFTNGV